MKEQEDFNFKDFEEQALEKLKAGEPLTGENGIFTPLIKRFLEASMEGELKAHLLSDEQQNRRNGKMGKTLKTSLGNVQINTPRDRNSSFDPQIIKKRQTVLNGELDKKIISMYSRGMSYSDIRGHLLEMYGLETSEGTISSVTDLVKTDVEQWQNRLDPRPTDGESMHDGQKRAITWLLEKILSQPTQTIVVVSHGDICAAILAYAGGDPPFRAYEQHQLETGSVSEIAIHEDKWQIVDENVKP